MKIRFIAPFLPSLVRLWAYRVINERVTLDVTSIKVYKLADRSPFFLFVFPAGFFDLVIFNSSKHYGSKV